MTNDFHLGEWLIQPSRNRIQGPDRAATVKLKSMAVLLELAGAGGHVVPKQALLDSVWGNAEVTEDVLTQCIVELRKAFQDSAVDPIVIETIRRVGFRLMLDVRPASEDRANWLQRRSTALKWIGFAALVAVGVGIGVSRLNEVEPADTSAMAEMSIAVLPFANISGDPENQYFADGLAEELLDRLTKVPDLRVPARTSSFAFRDRALDVRTIGRRLGVDNVLEGSIRKSGRQIRVTIQLIGVGSGVHKWSKVYEYEIGEVFAIQDEISESVIQALFPEVNLDVRRSHVTASPDIGAYDLYLLGRHHLRQGQTERARDLFDQAINKDPGYSRAYAGLAESMLGFRDTPGSFWQAEQHADTLEKAEWAVNKALELNPRLAEGYTAQAALHAINRDIAAEERALRKALDLNPNFVDARARLASNLAARGQYDDALQTYTEAVQLDPLNPGINAALSRLVAQTAGYEEALAYPLRLLDNDLASPQIYQVLVAVSSDYGRYADRVNWALRLVALVPEEGAALAELADAYMELGEFELARMWIEKAVQASPAQALKAQARFMYASGNFSGFERLAAEVFERNKPRNGEPLSLVQAVMIPLYVLSQFQLGNYQLAAHYTERILQESATLPRRPVHLGMYGRAILADCYQHMGERARSEVVIAQALDTAASAREQGINSYPPLTRELAKAYALLGDHEKALEYQIAAVAQGWRQYYLEVQGPTNPVGRLLEHDERYRQLLDRIQSDLEDMRQIVRRNGWDVTPEQFYSNL